MAPGRSISRNSKHHDTREKLPLPRLTSARRARHSAPHPRGGASRAAGAAGTQARVRIRPRAQDRLVIEGWSTGGAPRFAETDIGTMPIPARPPRRLDALGDDTEARLAASAGRHAAAIDRAAVPRLPPVSSSRARRLPAVDITTSHASFAVAGSKLGTGSAASVRRSSVLRGTGEGEVRGSIPGGTREHERDAPRAPPSNGGASRLEALRVDASDSRARREAKKRRDARGAAYAWGDGFAGELARFRAEDLAHVGGGTTFTACTTSRGTTLELRRRDERPRADVTTHTFKTRTSSEASGETSTSGEGGRMRLDLEGLEGLEGLSDRPVRSLRRRRRRDRSGDVRRGARVRDFRVERLRRDGGETRDGGRIVARELGRASSGDAGASEPRGVRPGRDGFRVVARVGAGSRRRGRSRSRDARRFLARNPPRPRRGERREGPRARGVRRRKRAEKKNARRRVRESRRRAAVRSARESASRRSSTESRAHHGASVERRRDARARRQSRRGERLSVDAERAFDFGGGVGGEPDADDERHRTNDANGDGAVRAHPAPFRRAHSASLRFERGFLAAASRESSGSRRRNASSTGGGDPEEGLRRASRARFFVARANGQRIRGARAAARGRPRGVSPTGIERARDVCRARGVSPRGPRKVGRKRTFSARDARRRRVFTFVVSRAKLGAVLESARRDRPSRRRGVSSGTIGRFPDGPRDSSHVRRAKTHGRADERQDAPRARRAARAADPGRRARGAPTRARRREGRARLARGDVRDGIDSRRARRGGVRGEGGVAPRGALRPLRIGLACFVFFSRASSRRAVFRFEEETRARRRRSSKASVVESVGRRARFYPALTSRRQRFPLGLLAESLRRLPGAHGLPRQDGGQRERDQNVRAGSDDARGLRRRGRRGGADAARGGA